MELDLKKVISVLGLGRWMRNGRLDGELSYIRCWFICMCAVLLLGTLWHWMFNLETSDSYLMSLPWLALFPHGTDITADHDRPATRATYGRIRSKEAAQQVRDHLACFSESGKWVYDPRPRHLPWNFVGDRFASTCDRRHERKDPAHVSYEQADAIASEGNTSAWLVREELKWVWQTNSSCPFRPVDRDHLCRKIGSRRNVMVVGDSLNHEISWSLMNHLVLSGTGYSPLSSNNRSTDGVYEMCGDVFGAGKGFKVSFVRNDRLSPITDANVDTRRNFYEFPWLNLLKEYDVKLLLMNRGAHYEDDEIYTKALRLIFTILSDQFPELQVIYRNTPPGHGSCQSFDRPLSERQKSSELPKNFHWEDFYRQNQLVAKIVEEFKYIYMDVDTMVSLRADGHVNEFDCLHYCVPGPLDISIQYLYNILLLL